MFSVCLDKLNLKNICAEVSPYIDVEGALIFTAIDQEVEIQSSIEDIEIVLRNNLCKYIRNIVKKEREASNSIPIDKESLISYFERYEILNPNLAIPITDEEMTTLRRGIHCSNCGSYEIDFNNQANYIKCPCGFHEPREEAILRTICDYGVLRSNKELSRNELLDFFGHQVSRRSLLRVLNKHFEVKKKGKYTHYINRKLPFEKIRHLFELDLPRIHYMKDRDYQIFISNS